MIRNISPILIAVILLLLNLQYSAAQTSNVPGGNSDLFVTVSAPIAPGVFHLVLNALPNTATPPVSPFVVAPSESVSSPAGTRGSGTLSGNPKDAFNPLVLKSAEGKAELTLKTAVSDGVSITFSFVHDAQDRFYGNGNESENHAGPLVHTSGKQVVNNGTTCVPFIWSPSGYGILVANNIQDVKEHITWLDANGTLTWTVPGAFADIYLLNIA